MSKRSVRYTIHFFTAISITAMVLFVIYGMQKRTVYRPDEDGNVDRAGRNFWTTVLYLHSDGTSGSSDYPWRDFLCSRCDLVWTMDGTSIQLYRDCDWIDD